MTDGFASQVGAVLDYFELFKLYLDGWVSYNVLCNVVCSHVDLCILYMWKSCCIIISYGYRFQRLAG